MQRIRAIPSRRRNKTSRYSRSSFHRKNISWDEEELFCGETWYLYSVWSLAFYSSFCFAYTTRYRQKKQSKEKEKKIYSIDWKRVWEAGDAKDENVDVDVGVDHVYVSVAFPSWSRDWTRLFRGKFVADDDEEEKQPVDKFIESWDNFLANEQHEWIFCLWWDITKQNDWHFFVVCWSFCQGCYKFYRLWKLVWKLNTNELHQ